MKKVEKDYVYNKTKDSRTAIIVFNDDCSNADLVEKTIAELKTMHNNRYVDIAEAKDKQGVIGGITIFCEKGYEITTSEIKSYANDFLNIYKSQKTSGSNFSINEKLTEVAKKYTPKNDFEGYVEEAFSKGFHDMNTISQNWQHAKGNFAIETNILSYYF